MHDNTAIYLEKIIIETLNPEKIVNKLESA